MDEVRIIQVKADVFQANNNKAELLRKQLKEKGTYLINLMSSPGSGKTTTLSKLIPLLSKKYKVAVMEADIDSDVDAKLIQEKTGVEAIQLHTGGMCHLDAAMTKQGLDNLQTKDLDIVFLENVGNLVCPAEFDTGSCINMMILSVPEGDDKPLKYPLMFENTSLVLVNKIDVMPYFDFSMDRVKANIEKRNPSSKVMQVCSKTGQGIEEVANYISSLVETFKKGE